MLRFFHSQIRMKTKKKIFNSVCAVVIRLIEMKTKTKIEMIVIRLIEMTTKGFI